MLPCCAAEYSKDGVTQVVPQNAPPSAGIAELAVETGPPPVAAPPPATTQESVALPLEAEKTPLADTEAQDKPAQAEADAPAVKKGLRRSNSEASKGSEKSKQSLLTLTWDEGKSDKGDRRMKVEKAGTEVLPKELNKRLGGKPNILRTTKFTWATWIPKSLFFQFQRIANVYFAFIALIVCAGSFGGATWSPKDWRSKIGPFIFVLLWTAVKDMYEDMRRKRDDKIENLQPTDRLNPETGTFEQIFWKDVHAGDVLCISNDQAFPADLVLLYSPAENEAFISTVMLDGETSLKYRIAPQVCDPISKQCLQEVGTEKVIVKHEVYRSFAKNIIDKELTVLLAKPDPVLANVRGLIGVKNAGADKPLVAPLEESCFLPRGCVLRSTPYVYAIVAYVGEDTKTRLNATMATLKFSKMQEQLNWCVRILLVCLFAICIYSTIMFEVVGKDDGKFFVIKFFQFCIALYHAVPMSLYVVYEMLKLVLGFQINIDKQMIDPETNVGAVARTADLMEEMGQVDFVFSDKTGTLTANEMVFAKCHVADVDPGDFRVSAAESPPGTARVREIFANREDAAPAFEWFFTCLVTCHSVVVDDETADKKLSLKQRYSGVSADEVALIQGAYDVGVVFEKRTRLLETRNTELTIQLEGKPQQKFEVLLEIPFTSARKRMSVIITDKKHIWCITKGADNIMGNLLKSPVSEACTSDIKTFSTQGLRVLIVASKEIDAQYFKKWQSEYAKAFRMSNTEGSKEQAVAELETRLEADLSFVGLTALEDRLQDGVPDAIKIVKDTGARLWVLTGDKTETAVNISKSCNLFGADTQLFYVKNCATVEMAREALQKCKDDMQGVADAGLVLDGMTLTSALEDQECRKLIFQLGMASRSCACTRLSPMQKLRIVQLVRQTSPNTVTLSIGDGANDVPMIQGAHVGIGIRGKEGAQAVQASDIAISQFRFLVPLMMCHGRRSYRRVALFLNYYLYKNITLLMGDVVWMHWDGFQARIAFPEYLSIGFNVAFTSWHVLFVLGFDRDVPDAIANTTPQMYKPGPRRQLFNLRIFSKWVLYAIIHGSMCWLAPNLMFGGDDYVKKEPVIFWVGSCTSFTCIVLTVLLKLIIVSENPFTAMTWIPTLLALLLYAMACFTLGYTPLGDTFQPNLKGVPGDMLTNMDAIACILLVPFAATVLDFAERIIQKYCFPTAAQEASKTVKRSNSK